MPDLYHYNSKNFANEDVTLTIASGPVVKNEEGKFLLHLSPSTEKYQFAGGRLDDAKSPQQTAIDKTFEDLGTKITLESNEPFVVADKIDRDGKKELMVLIHYLAKLEEGSTPNKGEFGWFSLDEISELEKQNKVSSPNVLIACKHFEE